MNEIILKNETRIIIWNNYTCFENNYFENYNKDRQTRHTLANWILNKGLKAYKYKTKKRQVKRTEQRHFKKAEQFKIYLS